VKKVHLLVFKAFVRPFVVTFFIVMFILLMLFLFKYIDDLIGKGLDVPSWQEVKSVVIKDAGFTSDSVHKQVDALRGSIQSLGKSGAAAPKLKITGDTEYDRLPSGTAFIAPDGSHRVKP
jgi:lipopolysaccharide export system permease protein